jgi:ATP-dependent Clp protease ATP-binding subunit ClpC
VFERFTDRARRVLVLAQEEARLLNHNFIGTEHLLIALIEERDGVAAHSLRDLGITLEAVRNRVEEIIGASASTPSGGAPFTPRTKKVLELSLREALQLNHSYIGTEHLLLGLVREGEGVGAQVLRDLGVELSDVRETVIQRISEFQSESTAEGEPHEPSSPGSPRCPNCSSDIEQVLRYRSVTIPPPSPNSLPLSVEVVYCSNCGRVLTVLRAEPTD